jgi:O-methyltransferase
MQRLINRAALKVAAILAEKFGYALNRREPAGVPVEFDAQDQEITDFVFKNKLTMVSRERLISTLMACRHVCSSNVPGDFVECGVWRGGNSLVAADIFARHSPSKKVYLFDTFAGMTAPSKADVSIEGQNAGAQFEQYESSGIGWCEASLEDVRDAFQRRALQSRAVFVQGDVLQTLTNPANLPETISVLRLDTDWYESTKQELEVLYPRLQPGGVLIVDDYGHWGGAKQAVDEYFSQAKRPFLQYVDYTGRIAVKQG